MSEFNNIDINVRKKQGNLGVAKAIYDYMKLGYTVCTPLSDSDKYDLVIDDRVSLKKVQVKTSRAKSVHGNNAYVVNLRTNGGNRSSGNTYKYRETDDYDILYVLVEDGRSWSIPVSELGTAKRAITVGFNKYENFKL